MTHFIRLFCLILIFAACKSDKKKTDTSNILTVRLNAEPDNLNPLLAGTANARQVAANIFETLLSSDQSGMTPIPALAKELPTVAAIDTGTYKGGVAYTYEINEKAKWNDGTPVAASDYVFTLKTIFNPLSPAADFRAAIDDIADVRVDAQNPRKFTIFSKKPYILSQSAHGGLPVLPEYVYDPTGLLKNIVLSDLTNPKKAEQLAEKNPNLQQFADAFAATKFAREKDGVIGNGAYILEEWTTGQRIVLLKNRNYWDADAYKERPDKIIYKIIPDNNAAMTALKDGSLDIMTSVPHKTFQELREDATFNQNFSLHTQAMAQFSSFLMNNKNAKLNDKRVRRALAHCNNLDESLQKILYGMGERTVSPFYIQKEYYAKSLPLLTFDIEKAKKLLAEAGWADTNGNGTVDKKINGKVTELELVLLTTEKDPGKSLCLLLKENAAKAGIAIEVQIKQLNDLMETLKRRDYDMAYLAVVRSLDLDDPKEQWHTESDTPDGSNYTRFGDKNTDMLIEKIRTTLDKNQRNALYQQFQQVIYEEQPVIFCFVPQERIILSKRFEPYLTAERPGFVESGFKKK
jgi:peptide/nickel transport system substrate-binding protein